MIFEWWQQYVVIKFELTKLTSWWEARGCHLSGVGTHKLSWALLSPKLARCIVLPWTRMMQAMWFAGDEYPYPAWPLPFRSTGISRKVQVFHEFANEQLVTAYFSPLYTVPLELTGFCWQFRIGLVSRRSKPSQQNHDACINVLSCFPEIIPFSHQRAWVRVPGLPIRDCAGSSNNRGPGWPKLSAIDKQRHSLSVCIWF